MDKFLKLLTGTLQSYLWRQTLFLLTLFTLHLSAQAGDSQDSLEQTTAIPAPAYQSSATIPEQQQATLTQQQIPIVTGNTFEPVLPKDLSPWGMYLAADDVVKAVMISLVLASLLTWTALIAKTIELRLLNKQLRFNLKKITAAHTLTDVANAEVISGISRKLVNAAETELHMSSEMLKQDSDREAIKTGIKERVISDMSRLEAGVSQKMKSGTGLLATIGSVAPFVGLFGTVWGIMNSFIGISQANTTNLAVVAPGIAEALLATALGLVAAIPAVVIYNHFTRQISATKAMVADGSAAIMRLVSRDLDRGTSLRLVESPKQKAE